MINGFIDFIGVSQFSEVNTSNDYNEPVLENMLYANYLTINP